MEVGQTLHIDRDPLCWNVIQKEAEVILKYENFGKETQEMKNVECPVILVVVGALGLITKGLKRMSESGIRKAPIRFVLK
jgi:hypothetical protein